MSGRGFIPPKLHVQTGAGVWIWPVGGSLLIPALEASGHKPSLSVGDGMERLTDPEMHVRMSSPESFLLLPPVFQGLVETVITSISPLGWAFKSFRQL